MFVVEILPECRGINTALWMMRERLVGWQCLVRAQRLNHRSPGFVRPHTRLITVPRVSSVLTRLIRVHKVSSVLTPRLITVLRVSPVLTPRLITVLWVWPVLTPRLITAARASPFLTRLITVHRVSFVRRQRYTTIGTTVHVLRIITFNLCKTLYVINYFIRIIFC